MMMMMEISLKTFQTSLKCDADLKGDGVVTSLLEILFVVIPCTWGRQYIRELRPNLMVRDKDIVEEK